MSARICFFVLLVAPFLLAAGCAPSRQQAAAKPTMRALGQTATPEPDVSDEAIGTEIRRRLNLSNAAANASVIVEVSEGQVILRGSVISLDNSWSAEAVARGVPGAKKVLNRIIVNP